MSLDGIKISAMAVTTSVSAVDAIPVVQGGINMQTNPQQLADFVLATGEFATLAQGVKADSAMQPADGVALIANILVVGEIRAFAFQSPPAKWLELGQAVSRATYAALYAAIGVIWGVGDGATTFNLPPRGVFMRSWDHVAPFGSIVQDTFASHTHVNGAYTNLLKAPYVGNNTATAFDSNGSGSEQPIGPGDGGPMASTGGAETAPKHINVLECIYAGV